MESLFETLLPLPLYRKLRVDKIVQPDEMRAARQRFAEAIDGLGVCRLTAAERDQLEVPLLEEDWYRLGRTSMLHRFESLLEHQAHRAGLHYTLITKEDFKQVGEACHAVRMLAYAADYIERVRDNGVLVVDLLLGHAVARIGAAVEARLAVAPDGGLAERWARVSAPPADPDEPPPPPTPLHAAVLHEQQAQEPEEPAEPEDEPGRDLVLLAAQLDAKALDRSAMDLIKLVSALGVPELKPWGFGTTERQQEEYEQLKREVKPHAADIAQAVVGEFLPAEQWVEEASGVSRAALLRALSWREELDALLPLRDRLRQDAQDTDRVVWLRGRYLMRTVLHDAAAYVCRCDQGSLETSTARSLVLFDLQMTLREMHRTPPPKLVREWMRKRREQSEIRWRFRLGLSLLYRAPQWAEDPPA